jgi:hypothetical protein
MDGCCNNPEQGMTAQGQKQQQPHHDIKHKLGDTATGGSEAGFISGRTKPTRRQRHATAGDK